MVIRTLYAFRLEADIEGKRIFEKIMEDKRSKARTRVPFKETMIKLSNTPFSDFIYIEVDKVKSKYARGTCVKIKNEIPPYIKTEKPLRGRIKSFLKRLFSKPTEKGNRLAEISHFIYFYSDKTLCFESNPDGFMYPFKISTYVKRVLDIDIEFTPIMNTTAMENKIKGKKFKVVDLSMNAPSLEVLERLFRLGQFSILRANYREPIKIEIIAQAKGSKPLALNKGKILSVARWLGMSQKIRSENKVLLKGKDEDNRSITLNLLRDLIVSQINVELDENRFVNSEDMYLKLLEFHDNNKDYLKLPE